MVTVSSNPHPRPPITVTDDLHFSLNGQTSTYSFYVNSHGDLVHTHFGGSSHSSPPLPPFIPDGGWHQSPPDLAHRSQKEFPNIGFGDIATPAIHLRHAKGTTVTLFKYHSHEIIPGKKGLQGLPATFGGEDDASTLLIILKDEIAEVEVVLSYAVFSRYDAFVRSWTLENKGKGEVVLEGAASFSVDLGNEDGGREMIQLSGEWARETQIVRRKVYPGIQGFQSLTGFSSHLHNPFLGIVSPTTTETIGQAYGFSLIYSGSFSALVERTPIGYDRIQIGLNPYQLSWPLSPGQKFTTPEAVAIYSDKGLGGMSRKYHRLYREHLSRSEWTKKERPVLINNWEGTYFDFDEEKIFGIAEKANEIGCSLAVLDDGWFGTKYPRNNDDAGLGDWQVNEKKLKGGLDALVKRIGALKNDKGEAMKFGLWVEPEHVNPRSELYEAHPEWTLHAAANDKTYPRVLQRNQYILDLSQAAVQDYLIKVIGDILSLTAISYVKWDCNKAAEQHPTPATSHAYILGLYRVVDTLSTRFPDILWEGCASGGGRFDPGLLHYWPGSWTSDNTDPVDRLHIQTGNSLVYPPSSMSGHVSASPNHQTDRATPLEFRAHVAMLCGSFGLELDPSAFTPEERKVVPELIKLSERIAPYIIHGDLYRLARPEESNWPGFMYVKEGGGEAVVLAYQVYNKINVAVPALRLEGLEEGEMYVIEGGEEYEGGTLMSAGLRLAWKGDYQSGVLFLKRK